MKWQALSLVSCLFWGIAGILVSRSTRTQSGLATFLIFTTSTFVCAVLIGMFRGNTAAYNKSAILMTISAGVCSSVAVLLQMYTFSKWQDKYPWIILIGGLYPTVVLLFALFTGERFTLTQWLGIGAAIIALVLVSLPAK